VFDACPQALVDLDRLVGVRVELLDEVRVDAAQGLEQVRAFESFGRQEARRLVRALVVAPVRAATIAATRSGGALGESRSSPLPRRISIAAAVGAAAGTTSTKRGSGSTFFPRRYSQPWSELSEMPSRSANSRWLRPLRRWRVTKRTRCSGV